MDTLTRALIADILGIAPRLVTPEQAREYERGSMDVGARALWWRRDTPHEPHMEYGEWPGYLPTLITEGSGGE